MNELEYAIHHALRCADAPEPSPLFATRVMSAVNTEVRFAPLPFPWRRIAAAVVFLFVAIGAGLT